MDDRIADDYKSVERVGCLAPRLPELSIVVGNQPRRIGRSSILNSFLLPFVSSTFLVNPIYERIKFVINSTFVE